MDEGTFFMEFEKPAVDLLWSQPLHSDWSRAPLRQIRKDKEPLRNASEDDSQALSGTGDPALKDP
jgi:hypothetical protein